MLAYATQNEAPKLPKIEICNFGPSNHGNQRGQTKVKFKNFEFFQKNNFFVVTNQNFKCLGQKELKLQPH